jgi:hypothetical protein
VCVWWWRAPGAATLPQCCATPADLRRQLLRPAPPNPAAAHRAAGQRSSSSRPAGAPSTSSWPRRGLPTEEESHTWSSWPSRWKPRGRPSPTRISGSGCSAQPPGALASATARFSQPNLSSSSREPSASSTTDSAAGAGAGCLAGGLVRGDGAWLRLPGCTRAPGTRAYVPGGGGIANGRLEEKAGGRGLREGGLRGAAPGGCAHLSRAPGPQTAAATAAARC